MRRAALAGAALLGAAAPATAQTGLDGVWASLGYGLVADVAQGKTTLYEVTSTTCIKPPANPALADALFSARHVRATGDRLATRAPWGLTNLTFERLAGLPPACTAATPPADDPLYNFDVFWRTFDEHYAFFAERAVDWPALRERYRAPLARGAGAGKAELIETFAAMFRQLQDHHVTLTAGDVRLNAGTNALLAQWNAEYARQPAAGGRSRFLRAKVAEVLGPALARYLDPGSLQRISPNLAVGSVHGASVGYVMVAGESGWADGADVEADTKAATEQLDRAFAGLRDKRALILDLRINFGGHDTVALALAGLMTTTERQGFSKCARYGRGYTPTQVTRIAPRAAAFAGPVIVLISPMTWSAGENLAMMLKDFPNTLLVGERTAGVHSDTLARTLPNGWRFTLSNELFGAPDGTMYETVGVQPDVLVAVEFEAMRQSGIDPVLEKALHLLSPRRVAGELGAFKRPGPRGRPFPCPKPSERER